MNSDPETKPDGHTVALNVVPNLYRAPAEVEFTLAALAGGDLANIKASHVVYSYPGEKSTWRIWAITDTTLIHVEASFASDTTYDYDLDRSRRFPENDRYISYSPVRATFSRAWSRPLKNVEAIEISEVHYQGGPENPGGWSYPEEFYPKGIKLNLTDFDQRIEIKLSQGFGNWEHSDVARARWTRFVELALGAVTA